MTILLKTIMLGVVGYLAVVAFMPDMSFWEEFFMLIAAPFVLFCQTIPTGIFTIINSLSEYIGEYSKANPAAEMLGWVSLVVGFLALGITLIYYILLFVVVVSLFNNLTTTSNASDLRELHADVPAGSGFLDDSNDGFWANQELNIMGLTTNKDIIAARVEANAMADALRRR